MEGDGNLQCMGKGVHHTSLPKPWDGVAYFIQNYIYLHVKGGLAYY